MYCYYRLTLLAEVVNCTQVCEQYMSVAYPVVHASYEFQVRDVNFKLDNMFLIIFYRPLAMAVLWRPESASRTAIQAGNT